MNRSYHGSGTAALAHTGDYRKWFLKGDHSGVVKFNGPFNYTFDYG